MPDIILRKAFIGLGVSAALLFAILMMANISVTAANPPERPIVKQISVISDPEDDVGITVPYRVGESGRGLARDNRRYAAGDTLLFAVTFDQNVVVTGNPKLRFVMGYESRTATFQSATDAHVVFSYPIVKGDEDRNGVSVDVNSLALNGGTIQSKSGTDANIAHSKLRNQRNHIVDGVAPRVWQLYMVPNDYTRDRVLAIGEEVIIRAEFSERVYASIAGPPQSVIQIGKKKKRADWKSTAFGRGFAYVIQEGDLDTDGISIKANSIKLNDGTIQDEAGNHAILYHSEVPDNWEFVVDGTRPVVKKVNITSDPGEDATYGPGDVVEVTVKFNEPMRVSKTKVTHSGQSYTIAPTLTLNIGGTDRVAKYFKTSGKNVLFTYTVTDADSDADGISINANQLSDTDSRIPGVQAKIRDDVGTGLGANQAVLEHSGLSDDTGHKVGDNSNSGDTSPDGSLEAPGPVGPVDVDVERGNGKHAAIVRWTANDTGGAADRYIVWMKPMDGSKGSTKRVSANKLSVKFKNVKPGITYRFSVRAENEAGKGERVYKHITIV